MKCFLFRAREERGKKGSAETRSDQRSKINTFSAKLLAASFAQSITSSTHCSTSRLRITRRLYKKIDEGWLMLPHSLSFS